MKKILVTLFVVSIFTNSFAGFKISTNKKNKYRDPNLFYTPYIDAALLQLSQFRFQNNVSPFGTPSSFETVPRFSYFFNSGLDFNYKLHSNFSVFTGLSLKNIGLILKSDSIKFKHRVYTLGFPLGFRIHNASRKTWFKAGVDLSWAMHYKMKKFVDNKKELKYAEWFSDRTATFFPSVFAGIHVGGISIGMRAYTNNFFNSYNGNNFGYEADLITFSLGISLNKTFKIKKHKDPVVTEPVSE